MIQLSFKFLSNLIDLSFVEKGMAVLLKLRKLHWNSAQLCLNSIIGTVLWELCFVLWMKVLRDFLRFLYWGFRSPLEAKGESYEFSKEDLESVITLIVLGSLFSSKN